MVPKLIIFQLSRAGSYLVFDRLNFVIRDFRMFHEDPTCPGLDRRACLLSAPQAGCYIYLVLCFDRFTWHRLRSIGCLVAAGKMGSDSGGIAGALK